MTYPPQGGYPDDPSSNAPDPHSPFGYPDQPAASPEPPAQYTQPPAVSGWPDSQQSYPDSPPTPAPGAFQQPQQPMGGGYAPAPAPGGGFAPPASPPPSSGNNTIGWVIGGIVAVVLLVGGIGAVILLTNNGGDGDNGTDNSATESQEPSQSPTDVVNAYYDAIRSHDVTGAYKTLCAKMQGSEDQFFGTYEEQQFWDTVDASTYTVGEETKKDDSSARVDIKQEIQGQSYDFYADLVVEQNEWKICYWGTPT